MKFILSATCPTIHCRLSAENRSFSLRTRNSAWTLVISIIFNSMQKQSGSRSSHIIATCLQTPISLSPLVPTQYTVLLHPLPCQQYVVSIHLPRQNTDHLFEPKSPSKTRSTRYIPIHQILPPRHLHHFKALLLLTTPTRHLYQKTTLTYHFNQTPLQRRIKSRKGYRNVDDALVGKFHRQELRCFCDRAIGHVG